MGRRFLWRRGAAEVEVREAPYAILTSHDYNHSPVNQVYLTGRELRRRLDGSDALEYQILDELRRDGLTDYLVVPMRFTDGDVHAMAWATDAAGGFGDAELDALRWLSRPLGRVAEILAMRRIASSLLSAYVGHNAGERILAGHVQRGDVESIRCVIWFSELRGFTALSSQSRPEELILLLNQVFDCQVPAVERAGGEVLKFIGDGMLAIFPVGDERAAAVCGAALAACRDAFAALDELNRTRSARDERPLDFGVSLHLGDVAYGNIGGASRLDFTCIGPAVNLAARIEGLTGKLKKRVLLSAEFARAAATARTRPLGSFELKGVAGAAEVHELDA